MRIRKFLANNYSEALTKVKKEFGEDALVLSTRSLEPDRLLGKGENSARVEITAAYEAPEKKEFVAWEGGASEGEKQFSIKEDELDLKTLIFSLLTRTLSEPTR